MCDCCGNTHGLDRTKCPAFGKRCHACGKLNHFQSVCRQKRKQSDNPPAPKVSQVVESSDSEDSIFTIESIGTISHNKQGQYFVPLCFKHKGTDTTINCQLDTGATCNVMSHANLCAIQQCSSPLMQPTTTRLKFYNNNTVSAWGNVHYPANIISPIIHFKIILGAQNPLLPATTCQAMGLISVNTARSVEEAEDPLIMQYIDVFQGMGCLPGDYHIDIDPTVPPLQHLPQRVPLPLKDKLKAKIKELEHKGVIKQVNEPTPLD